MAGQAPTGRKKTGDTVNRAEQDGSALFGGPLPRNNSVTEVARRILGEVSSGRLAPGTRLPSERQLAADLGVGRSTIREALAALDLLGVLETRQGAGSYIAGSASDLLPQTIEWGLMLGRPRTLDLVETRQHLEVVIASLATERSTPERIARLDARLREMESSLRDTTAFIEADVAFHMELAAMADNSVLTDILRSIRSLLEVWIRRTAGSIDVRAQQTLEDHRKIFDAVATGDPGLARAAMHSHMTEAGLRLAESMEHADDEAGPPSS